MARNLHVQAIDDRQSLEFSEQYLLDRLMAAGVGCLDDWLRTLAAGKTQHLRHYCRHGPSNRSDGESAAEVN